MIWTYRVFCDSQGRYSIREVFYERDGSLIDYGKSPVAALSNSQEDLMQLIQGFKEAFELPVLSVEEVDAQIAELPEKAKSDAFGGSQSDHRTRNISLQQVIAELDIKADSVG
jgi:hypothetical protein